MFFLIRQILHLIQFFIVPICFVSAWAIVLLLSWSAWVGVRDTIARSRQMHQIPCANCQFFTSDYHLKCTVHPSIALTEDAIGCRDHEAIRSSYAPVERV
ncbi:MAG TPA: hypothetical protein V6D18_01680 [Thermosynechococcaceae cyanobacterium]